jgi:hypothetical protein
MAVRRASAPDSANRRPGHQAFAARLSHTRAADCGATNHAERTDYVSGLDEQTRLEAARLERISERIKITAAVVAGLLLAAAASIGLLYLFLVLLSREPRRGLRGRRLARPPRRRVG